MVLVEVEAYCEQVGGHLWWRRWSRSRDILWVWTVVDGEFSDAVVPDEISEAELHDYAAGRFSHCGETLSVFWTGREESHRLRAAHFTG